MHSFAATYNAVPCVKGEIHNVLSVMRVNSRWASSDRFQYEIPLSSQSKFFIHFKTLHTALENHMDLSHMVC